MGTNIIYDTVIRLVEKIKQSKSYYSDITAAVFISDKGIHVGIDDIDIGVDSRDIVNIPAEMSAFLHMRHAGGRIVSGMAVVKLSDMSFIAPDPKVMNLLFGVNPENDMCLICFGEDDNRLMSSLRLGTDSDSFMDGFDTESDEPAKSTANVISGVDVDAANPFYEKAETMIPPDDTLSVMTEDDKTDTLSSNANQPELTPEELLKQGKKRKSIAKNNFLFRKRHS